MPIKSSSAKSSTAPAANLPVFARKPSPQPIPRHLATSHPSSSSPSRPERSTAAQAVSPSGTTDSNGNGNGSNGSNVSSSLVVRQPAAMRGLLSDLLSRAQFANKHGLSFESSTYGYKRDLYLALGYPRDLSIEDYRSMYERGDIAERIIEAYPRGAWSGGADIQEDEDVNIITLFEEAVSSIIKRLSLWSKFYKADVLAGLGHYSVMIIGNGEDNLSSELSKLSSPNPDAILYVSCYPEDSAIIDELESNQSSPRFGLPLYYKVDFGIDTIGSTARPRRSRKPNPSTKVHWSRIIHIAEGTLTDEIYGKPRLRAVYNCLLDLIKVRGGGSEAAWQRMNPGMHINLPADAELSKEEEGQLSDEIDEYQHGMRRNIRTFGTELEVLSANVTNFGPNCNALVDFISGTTRIPKRILIGSERGELASTQDRDNWYDAVDDYRQENSEPQIRQFFDRLIEYNYLPTPSTYTPVWPDIDKTDQGTKAEIISKMAKANYDQVQAGGGLITTSNEIRDRLLDLEPLDLDITDPTNDDLSQLRSAFDYTDSPSDHPDWQASHRAADRNRAPLASSIESLWSNIPLTLESLSSAIEQGVSSAIDLVHATLDDIDEEMSEIVEAVLLTTMASAARLTLKGAKSRGSFVVARKGNSTSRYLTDITLTFDAKNPRAIDWASLKSSTLIKQISPETREAVKSIIESGVSEGIAPRKLAKQIREIVGLRSDQLQAVRNLATRLERAKPGYTVYAGKTPITIPSNGATSAFIEKHSARYASRLRTYRSVLISRTETLHAANEGQHELWRQAKDSGQLPNNIKRVWLVTDDDRLRDSHAALAGSTAGIDEPFEAGIEPGEEPNCRCGQGLEEAA